MFPPPNKIAVTVNSYVSIIPFFFTVAHNKNGKGKTKGWVPAWSAHHNAPSWQVSQLVNAFCRSQESSGPCLGDFSPPPPSEIPLAQQDPQVL